MADPLSTLMRLRRLAVDQSRASLAEAHRDASSAENERALAMQVLVREARGAPLQAEHALSGSFAVWLPVARQAIARAEDAERAASVAVQRTRDALALCQAELKAASCLADQQSTVARIQAGRREQKSLDEQAQAGRRTKIG